MVSGAPKGLYGHSMVVFSITLDWTGGEINDLELRVVRTVASTGLSSIVRLRLDRWKDVLIVDVGFLGLGVGPFVHLDCQECCQKGAHASCVWN